MEKEGQFRGCFFLFSQGVCRKIMPTAVYHHHFLFDTPCTSASKLSRQMAWTSLPSRSIVWPLFPHEKARKASDRPRTNPLGFLIYPPPPLFPPEDHQIFRRLFPPRSCIPIGFVEEKHFWRLHPRGGR